jgi:hypothetical protein
MRTTETSPILARLFSELIDGANSPAGAFILNAGDAGLLRSLDKISAADASRSVNDGATIAAHAQHVLSGMIASIAHLAYHLGAIRQINKLARGPKEGTF